MTTESEVRTESGRAAIVRSEELRNERTINYVRIAMGVLGGLLTLFFRDQLGSSQKTFQYVVCAVVVAYGAVVHLFLRWVGFRPYLKYVLSLADVLLLSAILWGPPGAVSRVGAFKGPEFAVYFLIIALAAFRFSIPATVFAGSATVVVIVAMFVIARVSDTIQLGTIDESATTAAVSFGVLIIRIVFLSIFTMFLVAVARSYGRVIERTTAAELERGRQRFERQRIEESFSRYVTKQVAEIVLGGDVNLAGERRNATILFCDIRDFTRFSEDKDAEEVVQFLNDFFAVMIDVIFKYEGTLDKFIVPHRGTEQEIQYRHSGL